MVCKKVMSPDYLLQLTFSVFSAGKSQQHRSPTEDAEPGPARSPQSSTCHHRRYTSEGRAMSSRAGGFPATSRRCRRHLPPPPNGEHSRLPTRTLRRFLCRSGAAARPKSAGGEGRGSRCCLSHTREGGPAGRVPRCPQRKSARPRFLRPRPQHHPPAPKPAGPPEPPRAPPRGRAGAAPTSAVS